MNSLRTAVRPLLLALPLLGLSCLLQAQQSTDAVLIGSVLDGSHGSVAHATVTLVNSATGAESKVYTDDRGKYRTPPVHIGTYNLAIEAQGFKHFEQEGIALDLGDVREVNATLEIGQVSEVVEVKSAASPLQTSDSTVGTVITTRQIEDLPLNGRDYLQLAALSAGTIPSVNNGVGISIGGQAGSQTAFLLDGADNNNQQISTGHSNQKEIIKPSVDAIQEFKVVTNGYSAELGRSSSGVVSVSLKSGTNAFHGAAYEFLRNEALDAKNYFALSKAPYKRNQYGAAIGGPVLHNKLFFFGDFEIARIRQTSTLVSTLPSAAQRTGLLSTRVIDPDTGKPFQGQIPAARLDPVALRALSYLPVPQTSAATNNYVYASPLNQDPRRWDFRIDDIISQKENVYFRYSSQTQDTGVVSPLPPDAQGNYFAGAGANYEVGADTTKSQGFVLVHNAVWSPTIISSIHAGWNDLSWSNYFPSQKLTGLGIPGVNEANPGFSELAVTGYLPLGVSNVPNYDGSQNRQLSGDITWSKGAHSIKFGVQAYWLQTNFLSAQRSSGIFNFNGQFSGNPFADLLLGDASSASLSKWAFLRLRAPYTHFFVQDDWKISRHLTLNVGLRYELSPPAVEKQNKIANFDLDTSPGDPQLVLAGQQGDDRASRALQGVDHHQFAPRFGFAYSLPDEKNVLRGGYGIFYSNLITLGGMQSLEINPPNTLRISESTNPAVPSIFLSQGFSPDALSLALARNVTLVSYDRNSVPPTAQEWNFNIQRELPGGIVLEVGYYGNKLDHMWRQIDGNAAPPGPGNINSRRLYTSTIVPGTPYDISLANVVRIQKDGYSRYNALQAKAEKRYGHGLTFIASYAYSKTMALGDTAGVQNPADWAAERAVAAQDMTQHFVGSSVYDLPFGRRRAWGGNWNPVVNGVLGGWTFSPIITLDTGMPLDLTVNGDPLNSGQNDRPNVVGDWHVSNPTVQEWFNTSAFQANGRYQFGNAGRNVLRGPGLFNLDLAVHKTFRVAESVSAQLRLESFNVTNTPAFGAPDTQVGDPAFGQISSAGAPRDNQIALKIVF